MSTAMLSPPRGRVDRDRGIISGVKICGTVSKKGRRYTARALQEAMPLYEGVGVYADHADPGARRSIKDKLGSLRNVHFQEDGLYGDFHLNLGHPNAEQILYAAEHDPGSLGFSHNARGPETLRNGVSEVTKIGSVESVDLVARPATTDGLFESLYESLDYTGADRWGRKLPVTPEARAGWISRHRSRG